MKPYKQKSETAKFNQLIERFLFGSFDEATSVDDDDIGSVGFRHNRIAIDGKMAEHSFGINEVLGTAQRDESKRPFDRGWCWHHDS